MARYEWLKNESLSRIAEKVYDDTHAKKDNSKKPEMYTLDIANNDELFFIFYALNDLSIYAEGKVMPNKHTERAKETILKQLHDLANTLFEYGFVDEFDDLMGIKVKVSKSKIGTAKQYGTSFGRNIEKALLSVGTSKKRIRQIQRFVTDATLMIAKNRKRYEADLHELSTAFNDDKDFQTTSH